MWRQFLAADIRGLTQIKELGREFWSSSFVFMLEEDKRSLPLLSPHSVDPLFQIRL
jgi:hypothetical protein